MTESEIMKALECHEKRRCYDCPLGKEDIEQLSKSCSQMIAEIALDLINRKNAEIEKFADIGKMYSEIKAEARAEAIKEYVERVKNKSKKRTSDIYGARVFIQDLDQIAKEMGVEL